MRVVLDTNVFISAIFWRGSPHDILKFAEEDKITLVSSREILEELFGVLQRDKFQPYLQQTQTNLPELIEHISSIVEVFSPLKKVSIIEEDPSDNKFLDCALSSGASFIISGDHHLLDLKEFQDILIVAPSQFLKRFR